MKYGQNKMNKGQLKKDLSQFDNLPSQEKIRKNVGLEGRSKKDMSQSTKKRYEK